MTAATLDLPVCANGQHDGGQAPLQQLADDVAALWSAGTGLEAPTRQLLGRPLTGVSARDHRDQGRIVVELSLAQA